MKRYRYATTAVRVLLASCIIAKNTLFVHAEGYALDSHLMKTGEDPQESVKLSISHLRVQKENSLHDFETKRDLKSKSGWSYGSKKKSKQGSKKKSKTKEDCGVDYCEAKRIDPNGMRNCLERKFVHLANLYFPNDDEDYNWARTSAYGVSRYPAAVVYVEDVHEVQDALACAVNNGYKVSPRGGGHSYQALSTMDGYVVIDMGRTCKPDEFVIDKEDQGEHILEGSKYIGTMKAQAGCTNAVMLAHGHKHFGDQFGMTLIGGCPSVGITGYILGGGAGDISPYVGYGLDIVKEFQLVLYDGTVVKASEDENPDLYWASRGGGGGNGIVTHLTYKIVQAPPQKYEEKDGKKFTIINFSLLLNKDVKKAGKRIQEWYYDTDPLITGKFGGAAGWFQVELEEKTPVWGNAFFYLGSWREAVEDLIETGLIDSEIFTYGLIDLPEVTENFELVCDFSSPCPELDDYEELSIRNAEGLGANLLYAHQFDSYAEAEAFRLCIGYVFTFYSWTTTSGDFCADLDLDPSLCEDYILEGFIPARKPKHCTKLVVDAMLSKAGDPSSFLNSHGPSPELIEHIKKFPGFENVQLSNFTRTSVSGASMFPRFDDDFFAKLISETTEISNHLQHGAALKVHPDDTAYPWRNAAFQVEYDSDEEASDFIGRMVEGGYTPQGYYAYLNPSGMKKWRSYFFGEKWKDLSSIRAKYDPKDVFGKPLTIESIGE